MHMIIILLILAIIGVGFLVFFLLALWGAWMVYRYFQHRRQQRAHRLATYLRRLKPVVAELLRQANELDQASKYSGLDKDARWSKKYGEALHKLLDANAKLEETNIALVEQELASAQECLLYVIRTIHVVSYRLKEMEPVEQIIELQVELKLEHEREAKKAAAQKNHVGETRAADASTGLTKGNSKAPAKVEETKSTPADSERKADGHSVIKVNDKKKEILRDDLGKH